ncbi:hypothetical protein VTK26DRAFT_863 [Humicola hyalothermophila]
MGAPRFTAAAADLDPLAFPRCSTTIAAWILRKEGPQPLVEGLQGAKICQAYISTAQLPRFVLQLHAVVYTNCCISKPPPLAGNLRLGSGLPTPQALSISRFTADEV